MAGMGALVPGLVAVGWENFFLDSRQHLELSDEQSQQLFLIRKSYLASQQELEKALTQAELALYHCLESDVVSSTKLESNLKRTAELKAAIAAAHFKATLEAINVLDHRQHLAAERWLKLRLEMLQPSSSGDHLNTGELNKPTRKVARRPRWSTAFTPRQLGWKGW